MERLEDIKKRVDIVEFAERLGVEVLPNRKQAKERETLGKKLPTVETGRTSEKLSDIFNTNKQYIKEVAKIKKESQGARSDLTSGKKLPNVRLNQ
jgi:hypothetical protein